MIDPAVPRAAISSALKATDLQGLGPVHRGKVRDIYTPSDVRVLVATDRISAFDRVLGTIPLKGQVLNQLSAFWFEQTADLVANHVVDLPHPNVTVAREAKPLPVEVVVRGYITGVTSTSLWTLYDQGVDRPYGLTLPKGMCKNDPLPHPVITPTTKAAPGQHDERLTNDEVVSLGLVDADLWSKVQHIALEIFSRGQTLAAKAGLILVDTKYEFGMVDGELVLIDEVHTPDSSRYWQSATYDHTRQPKSLDKEHVRSWLASHGFRGDGQSPPIPDDLAVELATRYVSAFEQITGQTFEPAAAPAAPQIQQSIKPWRIS